MLAAGKRNANARREISGHIPSTAESSISRVGWANGRIVCPRGETHDGTANRRGAQHTRQNAIDALRSSTHPMALPGN
jgi:hypothetical protein